MNNLALSIISDCLLSGLFYLGKVGIDLPYCEEKVERTTQSGNIPCKFSHGKLLSILFLQKAKGLFWWRLYITGTASKSSESCQEARASLWSSAFTFLCLLSIFYCLSEDFQKHYSCLVMAAGSKILSFNYI